MQFNYTSTLQPTSLIYKWFESSIPYSQAALEVIDRVGDTIAPNHLALGAPRLAWAVERPATEDLRVRIKTPVDADFYEVRRARSLFDFINTKDRVYMLDAGLLLRNLTTKTTTASSANGTYEIKTITGGNDLAQDEPVWYSDETNWNKIPGGSCLIDEANSTISVGCTGNLTVQYSSTERVSTLYSYCLYINDDPPLCPYSYDLWNVIDELALMVNLERMPRENNTDLTTRIKSTYLLPPTATFDGVAIALARQLGLVGSFTWNGIDVVNLTNSGITSAIIKDLPQIGYERETLVPSENKLSYHGTRRLWNQWVVYVNHQLISPGEVNYPSLTSGVLVFPSNMETNNIRSVDVEYSYTNYVITASGSSMLLSATSNLTSGDYTVVYYKSISNFSLLPEENNVYCYEHYMSSLGVIEEVKASVPILIGNAVWSETSHWFDTNEVEPLISNIPVVFQ